MSHTPLPLPLIDGVLYIDNSSMELFTTCPRQAYYYVIRKREIAKDRIALLFGEAFHEVLRYLYVTHGTGFRDTKVQADVLSYAARLEWAVPPEDYRTNEYLLRAVEKYMLSYPAEPYDLAKLGDQLAVEIPFANPLGVVDSPVYGRITIVWIGKIDKVYRSRGRLGLMDHKTSSIMGPQFFNEFELAHQMYGYTAAVEHVFNEPVAEITINGLGCRKPTRSGVPYEFVRHTFPVDRDLLAEWHEDCLTIVSNFITGCEQGLNALGQPGGLPKHTKWCVAKYGPCQYRGVCTMPPSQRELALSTSEFRDVTWSPLKPKDESGLSVRPTTSTPPTSSVPHSILEEY